MDHQRDAGEPDAAKTPDILLHKPPPHNELLATAFEAVRGGKLGPYDTFDLSVSSSENPIQMVLRHQKTGRIKVANIDRCNGSIGWDSDFSIPWN